MNKCGVYVHWLMLFKEASSVCARFLMSVGMFNGKALEAAFLVI